MGSKDINKMNERRIKLNVGGMFYETTDTTLLSVNGDSNYFSAYLTRIEKNLKEEGIIELFIDRNGFLFQYILDYLRTGTIVSIPDKNYIIKGLLIEADFYLLESLSVSLSNKLQEQNMNKLNSNMNLIIGQSQSQSQTQIQSQSQNQNQILSQSQSVMSDVSESSISIINGVHKTDYSFNSYIMRNLYSFNYNTENFMSKESENEMGNNYLKYEFSLNEDF